MATKFENKYERLKYDLETNGEGSMKCAGPSMLPKLPTASTCFYIVKDEYVVGDIVFAKVRGRWIDSHLITKRRAVGGKIEYQISNNHGHVNGWTFNVYGKVIKSVSDTGVIKHFKQ